MASVSWQNASWTYTEAHSRKLRDYVYVGSFLPLNTVVELPVFKTSGSERKYGSAIYAVSKASEPHERNNSWPEADAGYSQPQEGWRALRVALICGGPSAERGISLNSARSVLDHLQSEDVAISCYYIDQNFLPYRISLAQLYSNTPSDFDYKVSSMAEGFESVTALMNHLCGAADIVFPLIHGRFGEDGGIQELLEGAGIPYIGTSAAAARRAFDKYSACSELSRGGFATIPSFLVVKDPARDRSAVTSWFEANGLDINAGRVVVKPACSGSSIGVTVAHGVEKAVEQAEILISEAMITH